jgi:SAM-dependent methyltransferase
MNGMPQALLGPIASSCFLKHGGSKVNRVTLERVNVESCEDRLQVVLHRNRYDFVLARLGPGEDILEIGTGCGIFTRELLPLAKSYIGIEYDAATCVEARQTTNGKAEIIEGDARNLPFKEERFSFVVCLEVIEHLGDFEAGVRNIHRCIRRSGTAVISVPYRRRGGPSKINEHHPYEPGERELVSLLQSLFQKVEVYYQYFPETLWMTAARRLRLRRLVGLDRIYADISAGEEHAAKQFRIDQCGKGLREGLIVVVSDKQRDV